MIVTCFFLALAILLFTVSVIAVKKQNFSKTVRSLLVGLCIVISILIYPMYRESYGIITSILFSLLYSLRALVGCQAVDLTHKVSISGWLYYAYYSLMYIAFITAPLFTTGFLLSVFGNISDTVGAKIIRPKEIHVFSHLNENSVRLCESINKNDVAFVFCNTKLSSGDKDSDLVIRARKHKAIILSCSELQFKTKSNKVYYYEISSAKDYNINTTVSLVEAKRDNTSQAITIAAFSSGPAAELLLDSIDKGSIVVKLVDDVKYTCYSLLDQKPLFESAVDNKISALIIGCDYTGTEMLKAILWCGQITGCEMKINVIDKDAEEREKQFRLNCPDIDFETYNIRFHVADVRTCDFEDTMDCHCNDANYIVVATGDDKINIDTAIFLRKYFLRNDRSHFHNKPIINLRVRDGLKNQHMDALCDANIENYGLNAFGSIEKMFSVDNLLNSSLERLSLGVHLAYSGALNGTEEQQATAKQVYYANEYNQRSSFAAALHIKYKLYACGIRVASGQDITEQQIAEYEKKVQDSYMLESLAQLEHHRWIAFMRTEGYSKADVNDVKVYYSLGKRQSHIHSLAKLHPALATWTELDELSQKVSDVMNKRIEFKEYDYDIVRLIPDIVRSSYNYGLASDRK